MRVPCRVRRWSVAPLAALLAATFAASGAAQATTQEDTRLIGAVQQQDSARIRQLLDEGVDVTVARADGATALLWAAHWDDQVTLDLLLAAGADPNVAEEQGVTPLTRAAENASAEMVSTLLTAGANPNRAQNNGLTPLIAAAGTGQVAVVSTLLAAGAEVDAHTEETSQTALMWATANRHHDAMRLLVDAGADVQARSSLGFTPLLFAVRNNDLEAVRALIAAGADVNHPGADGTYPIALAVVSGHADLVRFLLNEGADPNGTMHGASALHAAAGNVDVWIRDWLRSRWVMIGIGGRKTQGLPKGERFGVVAALLAAGADPNARIDVATTMEAWVSGKNGAREPQAIGTGNLQGATPLWIAAFRANRESLMYINNGRMAAPEEALRSEPEEARIVRALLDPLWSTEDGTTPLMVAAGLGHSTFVKAPESLPSQSAVAAVRMLVEAGADVNRANEAGFTALHGAAFRGLTEVAEFLVAEGADINAQDFRDRTAYAIAEGAYQAFYVQEWPALAARLIELGADPTLGAGGRDSERDLARRQAEQGGRP